jgi:hypothetical protein
MHRIARRTAGALAVTAAVSALVAAPGMAATKSVSIDGIKRPESALKAHHGRLFVAAPKRGKLVAFTHKAAFRAYVRRALHVHLAPKTLKPLAPKRMAKSAWNGDYATFYQHYNGYGWGFNINSGYQEPDLSRVGCFLFWCNNYNNQISSVRTHGTSAVLFDYEGFYGDVYVVGPNQLNNISLSFNDRASSAYDAWSW